MLLSWLVACSLFDEAEVPEPEPAFAPVEREGPLPILFVPSVPDEAPERFSVPLAEAMGSWNPRLESWVEDAICYDAGTFREDFLAEVDALSQLDEDTAEDVAGELEYLVDYCGTDDYCSWLAEAARARDGLAGHVVASGLGDCRDPELAPLLDHTHVQTIVSFHQGIGRHSTWGPELAWAVDRAIEREEDAEGLVAVLRSIDDPRAAEALLRLQAVSADAIFALQLQSRPEARERHQAACAQAPDHPWCDPEVDRIGRRWRDPLTDLAAWILAEEGDPVELAEEHPDFRLGITRAVRDCVDDELARDRVDPPHLTWCYRALVVLDREAAHQRAADVGAAAGPRGSALARSVQDWPETEALLEHLGQLDALPADAEVEQVGEIAEVLIDAGRGRWADRRTWARAFYPSLALRIASRVPDLDGFVFEEIPPSETPLGGGPQATTLLAWRDGRRWHASLPRGEGLRDVVRLCAFLNGILSELESDWRVGRAHHPGMAVPVVVGPEEALNALHEEGLLPLR